MELPRTPSFRLDGRRALVTGAGRGIGRAIAAALAEAGAEAVLAARSGAEVEAVAEAIRARGDKAEAFAFDVTDTAAVAREISARGPFQVLVNNAGTNRPAELTDLTEEDYDAVTDLNVRAAIFVCKAVAKGLIEAGLPGSIINISSQMGHVGGPKRTVYCATKHAIEGATKAMAWELGPRGIRVNSICPTFIETPMTAGFLADPDFMDFVTSRIALGRIGQVEDVMGAALFLASDASALVTGSALVVDGGWTAA
jgi:NAD(P)-dependent dehydrogenase (short-subunit alcohol dehydrogenase family)